MPDRLIQLVVEQSDGNPFYVEELIKVLIDDGVIVAPELEIEGYRGWQVISEIVERTDAPR